ncbi:LytR/AlgR family response regulator transcription factor [Cognatilysobacter bugurensis]|uniref:DNA-binding response regulator n=1 Tax=Cognatilysobacter bugurensis TaxID=543356 RepID=A0A918W7D0_9GAMM|nr:LytTR family DNA-binding domain-containing protein [Lysobacter bugurensis]GHA72407.1 DNA-binding response regulator [Lysobacter bugurensis]
MQPPLRVALVDDEPMARTRLRRMLGHEPGIDVVAECSTGDAAIAALRRLRPDVVFLDIHLPDLTGFGVLAAADAASRPNVVFVTAHAEHAVQAFDAGAVDYLLKPYSLERLRAALERVRVSRSAVSQSRDARLPDRFAVPVGARLRLISASAIDCVIAQSNYVELHVGAERHVMRETMSSMESRLDPERFIRIHRSRIVRLDAVSDIEMLGAGQYVLRLASGLRLSSGPSYRRRIVSAFGLRGHPA